MSKRRPKQSAGTRTKELLADHGVTSDDMTAIEAGELDWILNSRGDGDHFDLLLVHSECGVHPVATLTKDSADALMNAYEFDRRASDTPDRPTTFPEGDYEDWTGIQPDSDWTTFVDEYRAASTALTSAARKCAAAYLFVCRHTLELQLKALIMLGQQALDLTEDLPTHHDLDLLWTTAYPLAMHTQGADKDSLSLVRQVIQDFNSVDQHSFRFRYPVSRANKTLEFPGYVHSFSVQRYAASFDSACDTLQSLIRELRLRVLFKSIRPSWAEAKKQDQPDTDSQGS